MSKRLRTILKKEKVPKINNKNIWDLYPYLAKHIYWSLYQYKHSKRYGYPGNLTEDRWETILDNMLWAFKELKDDRPNEPDRYIYPNGIDMIFNDDNSISFDYHGADPIDNFVEWKEYDNKIKRGLKYFTKYFEHLWD